MVIISITKEVVRREYKSRLLTSKIIWDLSFCFAEKTCTSTGKEVTTLRAIATFVLFLGWDVFQTKFRRYWHTFGFLFFWRTLETKKTTPSSPSFQTKSWESTFRKVVFEKKFFFRVRETTENPSISQLPCYHKSYKTRSFFTYLHCDTTLRNGLYLFFLFT